jgi:hypothetical protein
MARMPLLDCVYFVLLALSAILSIACMVLAILV